MNRRRVEILDQTAQLEALVEAWTDLWGCARFATPFQHPAWILAFYRELTVQEPRILAAWQGSQLAMLAPFYLWRAASPSAGAALILAGNGVSDYLDALVRPNAEPCAVEAIRAFVAQSGSEWSTADFRDLDPQASLCLLPWLGATSDVTLREAGCPRLALPGTLDDALAPVSKKLQRDFERTARKLPAEGPLEISVASPDTLIADYEELVRLHTARWQPVGAPGIFSADHHRRFFRTAFAGLAHAGILRLLLVRLDGEPIAATCGFLHRRHYYHFIAGYDPRWSHLSVGTFAVYVALRAAVSEGAVCFDFLRGNEPYKYRWGARDYRTCRRRIRKAGSEFGVRGSASGAAS